jgi:hypothetical protein
VYRVSLGVVGGCSAIGVLGGVETEAKWFLTCCVLFFPVFPFLGCS